MFNVLAAIFSKEYVKTRTSMLILFALGISLAAVIYFDLNRLFMLDHPEIVWYHTLDLKQIPYGIFKYLPMLSATVFCFCQFLPEMRDERLRISLHLPCPLGLLLLAHIVYGLILLMALMIAESGAILIILGRKYPLAYLPEAFWTMLPWCLAGIYAYLCCAWVLLEPKKKTKVLGLILGVCICTPLFQHYTPGAFSTAYLPFILGIPLLTVSLFLPALHFRTREVE